MTTNEFLIFNETDGVYADPQPMTESQAHDYIKAFPKRFENLGYYLTSSGQHINPRDVKLVLHPYEEEQYDDFYTRQAF